MLSPASACGPRPFPVAVAWDFISIFAQIVCAYSRCPGHLGLVELTLLPSGNAHLVIGQHGVPGVSFYPKRLILYVVVCHISLVALLLLFLVKWLALAANGMFPAFLSPGDILHMHKKEAPNAEKASGIMYPVKVLCGRKVWERRVQ